MKSRRVTIDLDAKEDLRALHRWIRVSGSPKNALAFIRRIQAFAKSLDLATERGSKRDDIEQGFRAIPFESVVLAVRVSDRDAVVVRIFHSSQDWAKEFKRQVSAAKGNPR